MADRAGLTPAAGLEPAIEVRIAAKRLRVAGRSLDVLERIDLDVAEGEVLAIVGRSGAGKTSLLRAIAGLDTAYEGEIRSYGAPIAGPGRDRGLVFQEHRLMPWMTVANNVAFALPSSERRHPETRAKVAAALETVGLSGFEKAWPNQLSGGMAQRASLARALVTTPRILLLDEPLGALDSLLRGQMQAELARIVTARGLTAVLVTHDVDEALMLADRVVVMSGPPGRIACEVPVALPRPRDRLADAVLDLRRTVLDQLHQPGDHDGDLLVHPVAH